MNTDAVESFKIEYFGEYSHGPVFEVDPEEGEIRYKSRDVAIMGTSLSELVGLRETEEVVDSETGKTTCEMLLESGIEPGQTYNRSSEYFGDPTSGMIIKVYDDEDELERTNDIDRTMVEYAVERLEETLEVEG